jgi:hypothetical protein
LIVDSVWVQILVLTGTTWPDCSDQERREMSGHDQATDTEDIETWAALFATLHTRGQDASAVQGKVKQIG